MNSIDFKKNLEFGKIAEKEIEAFFQKRGYYVVRSYDYNGGDNKSPKMFSYKNSNDLILPDLDCSKNGVRIWIECKHYTSSPFNRKLKIFVHGILKRHYLQYLEVQKITGCPVYLFIKEVESDMIFGAKLEDLKTYDCQCGHCSDKCLIYFNRADFKKYTDTDTDIVKKQLMEKCWKHLNLI